MNRIIAPESSTWQAIAATANSFQAFAQRRGCGISASRIPAGRKAARFYDISAPDIGEHAARSPL
jgi:hypothetical protein